MDIKMFSIDIPFVKDGKTARGTNCFDPKKPYLKTLNDFRLFDWTEKGDGECIQIVYEGEDGDGRIHTYGKTKDANLDAYLKDALEPFSTSYMEEYFEDKFKRKPFVLYAEGISPKNRGKMYGYKDRAKLILFDVQNYGNKAFWTPDGVKDVVEGVNGISEMETLTYVGDPFTASIEEVGNLLLAQPIQSQFSADGVKTAIEGFVGRAKFNLRDNNGNRIITKVKVETLTGHGPDHAKAVLSYEEATARFRA
jgi:hypothetical protein